MIRRAGIILKCNDFYILVKSSANQKWSFPKGHIEENEDYETCAFREFKEETGISFTSLHAQFVKTKIIGDTMYFFYESTNSDLLCRPITPLNTNEIIDMKWFSANELVNLDRRSYNIGVKIFIANYM